MMNVSKLISLIALAIISSCSVSLTSKATDDSAKIRNIVDAAILPLMAKYDAPGMAVAVTVDDRPMFFNYGVASREDNTPISGETLFEIGLVSKTFTGTLARDDEKVSGPAFTLRRP